MLRRGKCRWFTTTLGLLGAVVCSCGSVDPGKLTLTPWNRAPDAVVFGSEIHPLLLGTCGAAGCHGRNVPFRIHNASPLDPGSTITHPSELPDPLQADYYTVMAYSDLDMEEQSRFLIWGNGQEPAHPGGKALSADERTQLIQWLEATP